jgi:hypothetical protein
MPPSAEEQQEAPDDAGAALEAATDQAIAACDGDSRAAVRALIVVTGFHEARLQALSQEIAGLTAAVSRGFARGRFTRPKETTKHDASCP